MYVFVERYTCVHIFLGVCGAFRLMLPDILNELLGEAGEGTAHALSADRDRGWGVGDDKPFESFMGPGGGILGCQHT